MKLLGKIPQISVDYWPFSLLFMAFLLAISNGIGKSTYAEYAANSAAALIALTMVIHGVGKVVDAISKIHW